MRWALESASQQQFAEVEIDPSVTSIRLEHTLSVIRSNLKPVGNGVIISGTHAWCILRIDAGQVELSNPCMVDGLVRGTDGASGAGGAAGMGGALLINGGDVSLREIDFTGGGGFGEIGEKTTLVGENHETSTRENIAPAVPLLTKVCSSSRPKTSIRIHDQIQSYMTPGRVRSCSRDHTTLREVHIPDLNY